MVSLFVLSLPAAATNNNSLVLALLISSSNAEEYDGPPQLFDKTRTFTGVEVPAKAAFVWIANSMALIAREYGPEPEESRNFKPMMRVVQFTPTTPVPLFPVA